MKSKFTRFTRWCRSALLLAAMVVAWPCFAGPLSYDLKVNLARKISEDYRQPFNQVYKLVDLAHRNASPVFPTALDLLAVMAVESRFTPAIVSQNGPHYGVMQLNIQAHRISPTKALDPEFSIEFGATLLKVCAGIVGVQAAFTAYNRGPYHKTLRCKTCPPPLDPYTRKVLSVKKKLTAWSSPSSSSSETSLWQSSSPLWP